MENAKKPRLLVPCETDAIGGIFNGASARGHDASSLEKAGQGVSGIKAFLTTIGLGHYLQQFIANGFDTMTAVRAMDEQDMREDVGMAEEHIVLLQQRLQAGACETTLVSYEPPLDFMTQPACTGGSLWMAQPVPPTSPTPALPAPVASSLSPPSPPTSANVPAGILAMRARQLAKPPQLEALTLESDNPSSGMPSDHPGTAAQILASSMGQAEFQQQLPLQFGHVSVAAPSLQSSVNSSTFHALLGGAGGGCGNTNGGVEANVATLTAPGAFPLVAFPAAIPGLMAPLMPPLQGLPQGVLAQSPIGCGTVPPSPESKLFALAQLAEEAAQMAVSASAFCTNPQDMTQVSSVAEAAEQASDRAKWAAKVVEDTGSGSSNGQLDEWLLMMRRITKTAAEVAERAYNSCRESKQEIEKVMPQAADKIRSKVPCRHFMETGFCREGASCRFSHDAKDQAPRPVMLKRQEECKFFKEGKCIRGKACAWAHGTEELDEITKYVTRLRAEKVELRRSGRNPPGIFPPGHSK